MMETVRAVRAALCTVFFLGALAASHGGSQHVETNLISIRVTRPDLEAWTTRTLLQDDDETPKTDEEVVVALQMALNRSTIRPPPLEVEERCRLSKGDWCTQYMLQDPTPRYPPKYYDKPCPGNCSGVGQCNHEYGICYCPAGWGGEDCSQPRKRPCKHMGPDKKDLGWLAHKDWAHTRCAGICDDDIAMCYCPPETKFGHQPAPAGSAPGTPPAKRGRPLFMCTPNADKDGNKVEWGGTPYADIFGPDGWCNSEKPTFSCPCRLDGLWGPLCDQPLEQTCVNQCSGHGECNAGFCKCHEGWYGSDCGRHRGGPSYEPGDQLVLKPWMEEAMTHVIATEDPPLTPTRRRPYIYVYDMKPDYSTDYWQYRIEAAHCIYRSFQAHNRSAFVGYNAYAVEPLLHELFLTSEHRTLDPEEADFFYAPISMGCLFDVYGWNDVPRWPADLHAPRTHGAAAMQREAARWLNATLPWFARRGGRDHIWLTPHDEGACAVWKEVWPGIMLTHWGRTDFPHFSGTEYGSDNYSKPITHAYHPGDWLDHTSRAHPCFDPKKDLVIPAFKHPGNYKASPYLGGPAPKRDIFAFFMGDMRQNPGQDPHCLYSRCIRQTMLNISRAENWRDKHNIMYGDRKDIKGDYSELLSRSTFCFVLPGDGWSPRLEDAVLHGCIPVIIMDDVQAVFEAVLDFSQFSLRIAQKDIPRVVEILKAVPQDKIASMQAALHKVWHRFRYMGLKMLNAEAKKVVAAHSEAHHDNAAPTHPGVEYATVAQDDAFNTILQWLHSRIPDVQGTPAWAYKPKPQLQAQASADKAEAQ